MTKAIEYSDNEVEQEKDSFWMWFWRLLPGALIVICVAACGAASVTISHVRQHLLATAVYTVGLNGRSAQIPVMGTNEWVHSCASWVLLLVALGGYATIGLRVFLRKRRTKPTEVGYCVTAAVLLVIPLFLSFVVGSDIFFPPPV